VRSWSGSPDETGVNRADLSGAIFVAADLSGLQLYGANLTGARLEACNLANVGFGNVTLDNAKLARANLEKADLSQSRMNQADLESAVLRKANLSAASLTGTLLRFADLREANLSGAKLNDVDLSSTALDGAILTEVDMRSAVLHDADLHGMDLTGSTLIGTDLAGTDLHEAILRDVILERAHLENVDLTGAILDEASLMGAILEGTNLSGASVTGTRLDSVSVLASIIVDSKTNLDDAAWGGVAIRRHADPKTRAQRIALYHDVARQNRRLAVGMRAQGLFADASRYRVNEQRMERRAMLLEGKLGAWQFSWLLDVVAGYGEHPERALRAYGIVVVMFALVYYALTNFPTPWVASASQPLQWYEAAVLSLSSFHGRGFFPQSISLGDPVAVVAAVEAVFGLFIELTFIATFTRRFFGN
jgi:uncharacterized protein YjbI with pentapeptide repeats